MTELIDRWLVSARAAGADDGPAATAVGAELLARWREPHRHYHTEHHLRTVLELVDRHADLADRPELVALAAWTHDAVYDPRATGNTNERASAALAGSLLTGLGMPAAPVAEVRRLVLLTAGHAVAPGDRDGALLCDADLAILATPPEVYDGYAAAIRAEYAHVPEADFRTGRARVLDGLLALPALFRLPSLADRWESPARANLRRELATLR